MRKGCVLDAHDLAHRVAVAEELVSHGFADDALVVGPVDRVRAGPGLAGDASPDAGGWTNGAAYAPGSNGGSIAPAPRAGTRTWLGTCGVAIAWVVARRRRRAARRG
jgi:hypothetical protein